ncbi:cellulose binding domain-containing protein [Actinoplanes sp. NPDC049802]|uniref:cellulose binding domain-containing protein n=1 Tax=Actinoplanes sp. NPDC049802 TaxID=3154742 RepID=UPI0033F95CF5
MIEPPRGVMRYTADQQQMEEHHSDPMAQRYDALAAWSESAETMTMAAVRAEPSPAYPQEPEEPRRAAPTTRSRPLRSRRAGPAAESGPLRTRRARVTIVAAAGVAALAAGATLMWGDEEPATPITAGAAATTTTVEPPHAETEPPVAPSAAAGVTASASTRPAPSPSRTASGTANPRLVLPTGKTSRTAAREVTSTPGAAILSASYGYQLDDEAGYRGSVRVSNTGTAAAADWTVALTVPGAEEVTVTSGDVTASQSGSSVTFRPSGAKVPASGSVSFSFTLASAPAELPTGCALDGQPCS